MDTNQIDMRILQPNFVVDDVSAAVGIATTTIRNWINHNFVSLDSSERHGKGTYSFFSGDDVVKIIIASELSHLGIGPKGFSIIVEQLTFHVRNKIITIMNNPHFPLITDDEEAEKREFVKQFDNSEMMNTALDISSLNRDKNRFFSIIYDKESKTLLSIIQQENPLKRIENADDVSKVIVDCFELARKSINILTTLPQKK